MIYAGLHTRDAAIPTFSFDGGVVLAPSKIQAFCGYGLDGSIDDNKPLTCDSAGGNNCVPGCGEPPQWCSRANPNDESPWLTCGLGWSSSGVRPWRQEELGGAGGLFDLFETRGAEFTGVGSFSGYNEIVVDTQSWIDNLPHSVEAIFSVECDKGAVNLRYGGTAATCGEAHDNAVAMHRQFVATYGLNAVEFPLLKLRPTDWEEPFAA